MATEGRLQIFRDRREAGRLVGEAVRELRLDHPVVLGLPRGGVPVAFEVARALDAPLDVLVSRKIGAPGNPELAIGAVSEGEVLVLDRGMLSRLLVGHEELEHAVAHAQAELAQRSARYRGVRDPVPLDGRAVVVVDDGLATGATARAAVRSVRARGARHVTLAAPVGSAEAVESLARQADEVVCLLVPEALWAIGYWYADFRQTSDEEVAELLARAGAWEGAPAYEAAAVPADPVARAVEIGTDRLAGDLVVPADARGLVIFAHGSGSSRHSARNRHVAALLNADGLATLLMDLLRPEEELDRRNVFDVDLLAGRLLEATAWARQQQDLQALPVGYFGASTGAGAALVAAAEAGDEIAAVVSRGGRPDLAGSRLADVRAKVLLLVGSRDRVVLQLNEEALEALPGVAALGIVRGATHLFEEPGALDEVASRASEWFTRHLVTRPTASS